MPRPGTRQERGYTDEWLALSAEVCSAPGATCHLCGGKPTPDDPLTGDHVKALAKGGARLTRANVKPAHRSCNGRKQHAGMNELIRGGAGRRRKVRARA